MEEIVQGKAQCKKYAKPARTRVYAKSLFQFPGVTRQFIVVTMRLL